MVEAFIAREKTAVTKVFWGTELAPPPGVVEVTVGEPVVKLQVAGAASGTPPLEVAVTSTCAVYVVRFVSGEVGVSVATSLTGLYATVAGTIVPPGVRSVKLELVTVAAFIGIEKLAVTVVASPMPVAFAAGTRPLTVGVVGAGGGCTADGVISIAVISGSSAGP
jgi:hypothetical protein